MKLSICGQRPRVFLSHSHCLDEMGCEQTEVVDVRLGRQILIAFDQPDVQVNDVIRCH
jgi:hypothetical protein